MKKLKNQNAEGIDLFWPIALSLGVLWLVGMLYGYRLGGAIHLLLAGAMVMMLFGLRRWWRRPA